jgi:cytochrome b
VRVWDPIIRIFHWSLVIGMVAVWITSSWRSASHQWIGLAIGALLIGRIVWGFVGSNYARFAQFQRGPQASIGYIYAIVKGTERRYLGHNPAGALMILALMFTITATVFS